MANAQVQFSPPGRGCQVSVEARALFGGNALIQDTDLLSCDPPTPLCFPERAMFFWCAPRSERWGTPGNVKITGEANNGARRQTKPIT